MRPFHPTVVIPPILLILLVAVSSGTAQTSTQLHDSRIRTVPTTGVAAAARAADRAVDRTADRAVDRAADPWWAGPQEGGYDGHFAVFTGDGQPASLSQVLHAMDQAEAVLVGEIHTDPVGHWIQAQLFSGALDRYRVGQPQGTVRKVALSLEMFERDVQGVLDEYLQDLITEDQFTDDARAVKYYDSDYRPMVEAAKEAGAPVLAANAPRRYVNRVSRLGRDALGDLPLEALSYLPPIPYPQPSEAYREEWTSLMREMPMQAQCEPPVGAPAEGQPAGPPPHAEAPPRAEPSAAMPSHMGAFMENGLHAQALWDASMAESVVRYLDRNPGSLVLHMVGGFHVENFTGIPEAIQFYRPETRVLVVSMDTAEDIQRFDPAEHGGRGDFVILTDKALDLNYARNCGGSGPS